MHKKIPGHFTMTYFSIRRFFLKFLLGLSIYLFCSLIYLFIDSAWKQEGWIIATASLMMGVIMVVFTDLC